MITNHQVFDGDEHGVSQMQLAGHVGRRDRDYVGGLRRVEVRVLRLVMRFEITALFPPLVEALLGRFEVVSFGQSVHGYCVRNDNSIRSGICEALTHADARGPARRPDGGKYRQQRDRAKPDCGS